MKVGSTNKKKSSSCKLTNSNYYFTFSHFPLTLVIFRDPINGHWAEWSSWSNCSATCDGGKRTRSRTCTDPAPLNGGRPCDGSADEDETCNEQACESKLMYSLTAYVSLTLWVSVISCHCVPSLLSQDMDSFNCTAETLVAYNV